MGIGGQAEVVILPLRYQARACCILGIAGILVSVVGVGFDNNIVRYHQPLAQGLVEEGMLISYCQLMLIVKSHRCPYHCAISYRSPEGSGPSGFGCGVRCPCRGASIGEIVIGRGGLNIVSQHIGGIGYPGLAGDGGHKDMNLPIGFYQHHAPGIFQ